MEKVVPDGKHLRLGTTQFRVKGVTYGTFLPRSDDYRFPEPAQVMALNGEKGGKGVAKEEGQAT